MWSAELWLSIAAVLLVAQWCVVRILRGDRLLIDPDVIDFKAGGEFGF